MLRNRIVAMIAGILFVAQWAAAAEKQPDAGALGGFYSNVLSGRTISVVDPDESEVPSQTGNQVSNQSRKSISIINPEETASAVPAEVAPSSAPASPPAALRAPRKAKLVPRDEGKVQESVPEISLPSTTPDDETGGQVAIPEITQKAKLSRSDVNLIVCREPIKDVFYSKEKGLKVDFSGNTAYVKFPVEQDETSGKIIGYSTIPTELFIPCGSNIYKLIAVPSQMSAQTIRLESGKLDKAKANAAIFRDLPIKRAAKNLIYRAYTDDLPDSFSITAEDKPIPQIFRDLTCRLRRTIKVEGEGLTLKEYSITSAVDGIELWERDFIRKEFSIHPFVLGFATPRLNKGETTRLFVVELKAHVSQLMSTDEGDADVQ